MKHERDTGRDRQATGRHIVLVGVRYTHHRGTGDKNFWATLVPRLAPYVDRISVVSIRSSSVERESSSIGDCTIETRYVPPMLEQAADPETTGRGGSYRRLGGLVRKQLLVRRISAAISELIRDHPAQVVHLMDNFGPANRILARTVTGLGARPSVTAIAYERRGRRLYHLFLRASYGSGRLRVVALSRPLRQRLAEIGIPARRLTWIPWGVPTQNVAGQVDRPDAIHALGLQHQSPVVLWAGFIQQVREPDFRHAYDLAAQARAQGNEATFLFCFKPDTFRLEYAALHRPGDGLHVMPTTVEQFSLALRAADMLFSPIFDRDCIIAPPLTWIEAMASGIPILTTSVPGASELVTSGNTGYIADADAAILDQLTEMPARSGYMGIACREKVAADYNLDSIARQYVHFWYGGTK